MTNSQYGLIDKFKPDHIFIICPTLKLDSAYDAIKDNLKARSTTEHEFEESK